MSPFCTHNCQEHAALAIHSVEEARGSEELSAPCVKISLQQGGEDFKRRDDTGKRNIKPSSTLFVGNLNASATGERDLEDYFGEHEGLTRVEIKHSYAFVEYENIAQAEAALRGTHRSRFKGTFCMLYSPGIALSIYPALSLTSMVLCEPGKCMREKLPPRMRCAPGFLSESITRFTCNKEPTWHQSIKLSLVNGTLQQSGTARIASQDSLQAAHSM